MDTLPPNGAAIAANEQSSAAMPAPVVAFPAPPPLPYEAQVGGLRFSRSGFGNLFAALARAQAEFPVLNRNRSVTVAMRGGGSYDFRYATFDHIVHLHRPILARHGIAVTQPCARLPDGSLVLHTLVVHGESGEWMLETLPLPDIGSDPQGFGSRLTYLKRYAYCSKLNIAAEEDDDGNAAHGHVAAVKEPPPSRDTSRDKPAPTSARGKLDGFSNAPAHKGTDEQAEKPEAVRRGRPSAAMPAPIAALWEQGKWSKAWAWVAETLPALPQGERQAVVDAHAALLHRAAEFSTKGREAVDKLIRECGVQAPPKPAAEPKDTTNGAAPA
jgi:hypothetical protein